MIVPNAHQQAMLDGDYGVAKQMAMRLVLDMAAAAGAHELIPIQSAHLSGVSPLTGGMGLRTFLAKLSQDPQAQMAIPTTLNSAGCDEEQFAQMRIVAPNFLAHNHEIVESYTKLGVQPTQSCIPYEWDGVVTEGVAAWAESNAICFGNSYCDLLTNRESGLSALACAMVGYTPKYGLLVEGANRPNLHVNVTTQLADPTDFSILGDWFGTQRKPSWKTPLGPIPVISGLPSELNHEQRKALTAAAANYGSPQLYIDQGQFADDTPDYQDELVFSEAILAQRYADLAPATQPSLIVIGCPQASIGEIRAVAELLKGKKVQPSLAYPDTPMLWVFTSSANRGIAEQTGIAQIITDAGGLLLANTCPEVVPYDRAWVKHILTNSMKAEHYIKSGLNGIPTSVMKLADCIAFATGEKKLDQQPAPIVRKTKKKAQSVRPASSTTDQASFSSHGHGLPSQSDFTVRGEAFVTDTPITLLGYVNRVTGEIEEAGHPANGESMAGKIAIFPKGSGSTVAPYVLLELFYRGNAPIAIANTQIDQQCAPACSLEDIPYAHSFDADIIANIQSGDQVELTRRGDKVTLTRL